MVNDAPQGTEVEATGIVLPFPTTYIGGTDVERLKQYSFYEIGKKLQTLASHEGDVPRHAVVWDLFAARTAVEGLLLGTPIPLSVSKPSAQDLYNSMSAIYNFFFSEEKDGKREFRYPSADDPAIPEYFFYTFRNNLVAFETVFAAEMGETITYFVPRKGIYATPALADAADESFPAELRHCIPEKAKADWRSAGRCLAFNLLSASGFHVARAVEATMEAYYQLFSGKPGKTLRSWDDYHKELEKISKANPKPSPEEKTLAEFDQMRKDYRNPIVHPRVTLSEPDARILFNNGESLIIAMASEIKNVQTSQGGVQPALGLISGGASP